MNLLSSAPWNSEGTNRYLRLSAVLPIANYHGAPDIITVPPVGRPDYWEPTDYGTLDLLHCLPGKSLSLFILLVSCLGRPRLFATLNARVGCVSSYVLCVAAPQESVSSLRQRRRAFPLCSRMPRLACLTCAVSGSKLYRSANSPSIKRRFFGNTFLHRKRIPHLTLPVFSSENFTGFGNTCCTKMHCT